jgi:hypothetical protein
VGLPARGKSYLSNKLTRYLEVCGLFCLAIDIVQSRQWLEYKVKVLVNRRCFACINDLQVFNVGQLRRQRAKKLAEQSVLQISSDRLGLLNSQPEEEGRRRIIQLVIFQAPILTL